MTSAKETGRLTLDIVIGITMVAAIWATTRRVRWAMAVATALYAAWLWLQIDTWWIGYARGASQGWQQTYARFFSQTTQVLPAIGGHLPPDACHLVLQILIVAALLTTGFATISFWQPTPSPPATP